MIEKYNNKNVCIELKNGSKYFGIVSNLEDSKHDFFWFDLIKNNKKQTFCETEIVRVEVLE